MNDKWQIKRDEKKDIEKYIGSPQTRDYIPSSTTVGSTTIEITKRRQTHPTINPQIVQQKPIFASIFTPYV